jgi:hypothetical protein
MLLSYNVIAHARLVWIVTHELSVEQNSAKQNFVGIFGNKKVNMRAVRKVPSAKHARGAAPWTPEAEVTKATFKPPEKRAKPRAIRWSQAEYDKVAKDAATAKLPFAQYVRELAVGTQIRHSRSLPLEDRKLLAANVGAMNAAGEKLTAIAEELELGDVPFESDFTKALFETNNALTAVEGILDRIQKAIERMVDELETS